MRLEIRTLKLLPANAGRCLKVFRAPFLAGVNGDSGAIGVTKSGFAPRGIGVQPCLFSTDSIPFSPGGRLRRNLVARRAFLPNPRVAQRTLIRITLRRVGS